MVLSAVNAATILWRGEADKRRGSRRSRLSLAIALASAVLLTLQAVTHPTIPMLAWALFGMIWVIVSAANKVISRVTLAELTMREQLLRLELRLAEGTPRH